MVKSMGPGQLDFYIGLDPLLAEALAHDVISLKSSLKNEENIRTS